MVVSKVLLFSPRSLGKKMIQFDGCIFFQMGGEKPPARADDFDDSGRFFWINKHSLRIVSCHVLTVIFFPPTKNVGNVWVGHVKY